MKKTILFTLLSISIYYSLPGQEFYSIVVKQNKSDTPLKLGIRGDVECEDCGKITFLTWISNLEFTSPTDKVVSQKREFEIVDGKERSTYSIMVKSSDRNQDILIKGPYIETYTHTLAALEAGARRDYIIEYVEDSDERENLGSYFINTVPENAKITIKGEPDFLNYTPYTISDRIPGRYYLSLEKNGFVSRDLIIDIEKGIRLDTVVFLEEDLSVMSNLGSFHINTQPEGANITIKGESGIIGQTPHTLKDRIPGTYYLSLEKSSFQPVDISIEIEKGKQSDMTVKLIPEEEVIKTLTSYKNNPIYKMHRRKQAIWLGASVLSAGGTAYFKVTADKMYNQYQESTDADEIENLKSKVQLYDRLTYVFVGLTAFCLVEYTVHTVKKGKVMKQLTFNVTGNGLQLAYRF